MNSFLLIVLQVVLLLVASPGLVGLVRVCKARFQNRRGPSILQPYWALAVLLRKEMTVTKHSSWVFPCVPWVVFGSALLLAILVPTFSSATSAFGGVGSLFLIAPILAIGSLFLVLGGMDVASAFGGMGSSREMTLAALVEPALFLVLIAFGTVTHTWDTGGVIASLAQHPWYASAPFLTLSCIAMVFVLLAENARYPVDNPATHLELTMVHEAMMLEYSGPALAMLEWASALKLSVLSVLLLNLVWPIGVVGAGSFVAVLLGLVALLVKLALAGFFVACVESLVVKMRFYRMQEYLSMAYFFALGGLVLALIFLR